MKRYIFSGLVVSVCLVAIAMGCTRSVSEKEATEEAAGRAASQVIQLENTPSVMGDLEEPSAEIPSPDPAIGGGRAAEEVVNEAKGESMPVEPLGVGDAESENDL